MLFGPTNEGQSWTADQPGPDPQRQVEAGSVGRSDHARTTPASSITARSSRSPNRRSQQGRDLGRLGRRARARHAGRRENMVERHAARACRSGSRSTRSSRRRTTPAVAYVAATMYKLDDFRPYIYRTSDYGKTWKKIVERHSGQRVHARDPRGSESARAAGGRDGDGLYISYRRRRELAAVPAEPAGRADQRTSRSTRERTNSWWPRRAVRSTSWMNCRYCGS